MAALWEPAEDGNGLTGQLAISYAEGDQIAPDGARSSLSTVDPLKLVIQSGKTNLAAGTAEANALIDGHTARIGQWGTAAFAQ
ncbi:hypothetical protein [Sphingomonas sp. SORGH_AS_0879]|uniref:hypothetical protein n=1 Tax=Sphingomonas sp. SORGH_AS_0879 TaxID=3041790 RepID=UPI0027D866B2|nr:hypothetical protein [Sphingomonas sp. SORGH_AS_0879]